MWHLPSPSTLYNIYGNTIHIILANLKSEGQYHCLSTTSEMWNWNVIDFDGITNKFVFHNVLIRGRVNVKLIGK